jgi:ferredoxin
VLAVDETFEIVLQKSGKSLQVPPGKSILDVLIDAGVNVAYSCQQGICGTCETKVLSGIPDHRDMFLNEDEQESNAVIMVCCSRSKSPQIVLDL